jgi:NAD(P)-dependent dehydrogenase (short-subunit alcohol dehydrogenase family)/acyl carrier protein
MAPAKHMGKVLFSRQDSAALIVPATHSVLPLRSYGTLLITGGLGGYGLATAQWMVEQGARHLVLMGRRGVTSSETGQALEAMQQMGAQIVVAQADVVQEQQVADVVADIDRSMPPLRGVIHAAMVLDDGFLSQLDQERFMTVMAPKVIGAWNLHTQTSTAPLDFFVLFSSVTSLVGNPGQGNYVAANAFLDALSHHRRAQNLPAMTINWGAIAEVGYLSRHREIDQHLERQGLIAFTREQAMTILEHLLQHNPVQLGALNIDWQKWGNFSPAMITSPRFAHLIDADGQDGRLGTSRHGETSLLDVLLTAPPQERQPILETHICEHVARVLGTSASKLSELDLQQPLNSLGMDSLMAVQLKNRIETALKVPVPITHFLQSSSVAQLAAQLLEQLVPMLSTPIAEQPLVSIDQLSDEEVDAMLRDLLAAEEE